MAVTRYSAEELATRNTKSAEKLVRSIRKNMKDLLRHPKSEVGYYYDADSKSAEVYLSHPNLMDPFQRMADMKDMRDLAASISLVKDVRFNPCHMPTYSDFFDGCMPSVSIMVYFR